MDLLGDKTPQEMQDELDAANSQIEELESQLQSANSSGEQLAQRILDLEEEVNKANDKTSELQTVLDETVVEDEPLSESEMYEVMGKISFTTSDSKTEVVEGITFENSSKNQIKVSNSTSKDIKVIEEPGGAISTIYKGNYETVYINKDTEYIEIIQGDVHTKVYIIQ